MTADIINFPPADPTTPANDQITDNCVVPFMVDNSGLHGRYVRLGSVIDDILTRHPIPDVARALLGEFMVMGAGMATSLKYDGIFTLQTQTDGAVPMLMADLTTNGNIRGYAQVTGDVNAIESPTLPNLLGSGYGAFTVDLAPTAQEKEANKQTNKKPERYQGIIELTGDTLTHTLKHYYEQSQQIAGTFKIACAKTPTGWRASAILVQRLAVEDTKRDTETESENWRRCSAFVESLTDAEILAENATADRILYNLFHEDGVRLYPPQQLYDKCRCDKSRIHSSLSQLSADDRQHASENGIIETTCDFCQTTHTFNLSDFA